MNRTAAHLQRSQGHHPHKRPTVKKVTGSQASHDALEDKLSRPLVRKALRWMTHRQADGKCFFEKVCENYDQPSADFATRLRWSLPNLVINLALKKANSINRP
jgi:hypothetical protein